MGMVVPQHVELWVLVVSAVVTLASFFLMATRLGLAMRSINDDEDATIVLGVNVRAIQVAAFTIGGAFAGLSGALYALNFGFVEAQYFNALLSIYVLLFVLIGGTQTAWGRSPEACSSPSCRSCSASAAPGATSFSAC